MLAANWSPAYAQLMLATNVGYFQTFFDSVDKSGDGQVSLEEYGKAMDNASNDAHA